MNSAILVVLSVVFYLASAGAVAMRLFRGDARWLPPRPLAIGLGFAGAMLHALVLYRSVMTDAGMNLGFFNALSLSAWTIALLLLLSSVTKPVENLGILLLPLAALMETASLRYPSVHLLSQFASWGMKLHVLVSILAYSLLTLASVQALLLAVQDHQLHNRHPGGFVRSLPPLQTMEALLFEMIGVGFALLTLSLISGFVFLEDMFAQHLVHKTVLAILGWFVFGTLLWGRFRYGWRGRTAITWTLSGFVVLMLAYFGSKAVIELILQK